MSYQIKGVSASMAPQTVHWRNDPVSIGLNGQAKYSRFANATLIFDAGGSPTHVRQWIDAVSSGSFSIQLPGRVSSASFTNIPVAYGEIIEWPVLDSVVMGTFTIVIRGLLV